MSAVLRMLDSQIIRAAAAIIRQVTAERGKVVRGQLISGMVYYSGGRRPRVVSVISRVGVGSGGVLDVKVDGRLGKTHFLWEMNTLI